MAETRYIGKIQYILAGRDDHDQDFSTRLPLMLKSHFSISKRYSMTNVGFIELLIIKSPLLPDSTLEEQPYFQSHVRNSIIGKIQYILAGRDDYYQDGSG